MEGTQLARLPNEVVSRINDVVMHNTYTRCYPLSDGTLNHQTPSMLTVVSKLTHQCADQAITLDAERFRCVESVFAPCMIGILTLDLSNRSEQATPNHNS